MLRNLVWCSRVSSRLTSRTNYIPQASQRFYAKSSDSDLRREFNALPKEEREAYLERLRKEVAEERHRRENPQDHTESEHQQEQSNGDEFNRVFHAFKIATPCFVALIGLHLALGYLKRQDPTTEATIIDCSEQRIIYEYHLFGKTLRRLQKTNGVQEGLHVGDTITIHYLPKNPLLSVYNPPLLYVPWIHTSSAKEVEFVDTKK